MLSILTHYGSSCFVSFRFVSFRFVSFRLCFRCLPTIRLVVPPTFHVWSCFLACVRGWHNVIAMPLYAIVGFVLCGIFFGGDCILLPCCHLIAHPQNGNMILQRLKLQNEKKTKQPTKQMVNIYMYIYISRILRI